MKLTTPTVPDTGSPASNCWMDLRHGDCLAEMAKLPDGCMTTLLLGDAMDKSRGLLYDHVITSPPYDDARDYKGFTFNRDTWMGLFGLFWSSMRDGGVVVWVVGSPSRDGSESLTPFRQAADAVSAGFRLHDTMIWRKTNPPPCFVNHKRYTQSFEYMFVFSKGAPRYFNPMRTDCVGSGGMRRSYTTQRDKDGNVSRLSAERLGGYGAIRETKPLTNVYDAAIGSYRGIDHPAVMPIAIPEMHIETWTTPGDTILDPFMGSGTTGVACKRLGRNFIGIELDAGYFEIARKRIADAETYPPNSALDRPERPIAATGCDRPQEHRPRYSQDQ